ncbi:MAG: hypothetical protein II972_05160 [Elusimicrobiaceae bacterium]|nr:hypothetical protein [Elusimicrobiaceae bacterium]
MYLQKKSSKRKTFAPVSAKRRKKRRIKRIFLFFTICVFLFLFLWCFNKAIQYVFEHKSHWFTWKAQALEVQVQDEYTKKQIEDLIAFKKDSIISGEEAKNIQNTLLAKLPQVKELKVKRGFFSKKLTITAQNHAILAIFEAGAKSYLLSQTGVLFNYDRVQITEDILKVKTGKEVKGSFLSQELVKLLKDISKNPLDNLDFISLDMDRETYTLNFKDGTIVAMGLFDLYNDKIVALKDIIDIAQKKGIKKPYKIDFSYFKNGKIYLDTQV